MKNLESLSEVEISNSVLKCKDFETEYFPISKNLKELFTSFKIVEGKVFLKDNEKFELDVTANFYDELINQYQNDYSEYLIPDTFCFGRDSFGNLFLIDNNSGSVLFFNHDENKYRTISSSFSSFIENLKEDDLDDDDDDIVAESFSFDPDLFK